MPAFVLILAVLLAACAGPSAQTRMSINQMVAAGDYKAASTRIEKEKDSGYGEKNSVLYYLDLAVVQHDARQYQASNQSLALAEQRMDDLYTKSVSREAGRFVVNDNTVQYAGERFERVLVNVYRAMNYLFLGARDSALVEARKLSRLLQEYADTYGATRTAYKDDAFAQYVSGLIYADGGQPDDARISLEAAAKTYATWNSAFGTTRPTLEAPAGDDRMGELVFVHANGVAPRKVSQSFTVGWTQAVNVLRANSAAEPQGALALSALRAGVTAQVITVSFPTYVQDSFSIAGSEIEVEGRAVPSELVYDVSAIAKKTLSERETAIKVRAVTRATVKYLLRMLAVQECEKKLGKGALACSALNLGGNIVANVTEFADTRAWSTLPSQFRMARMRLAPGTYDVVVRYKSAAGALVATRTLRAAIRPAERTYLHDRTAR